MPRPEQRNAHVPLSRALVESWRATGASTKGLKPKLRSFVSSMRTTAEANQCSPCVKAWKALDLPFRIGGRRG